MTDSDNQSVWRDGLARMTVRLRGLAQETEAGFPHWADAETGRWVRTPDGDWTGGALPGQLWLAYHATGDDAFRTQAKIWLEAMSPRALRRTAFKGFGFWYAAALGDILAGDADARALGLTVAESLRGLYDEKLGLIPLGPEAEEHGAVGAAFSSIDSLQATPILFWASKLTGDPSFGDVARRHTSRVLDLHMLPDGSVVQSTELDAETGDLKRRFTHKGYDDASIWGRAQGWAILYAAMAFAERREETRWIVQGVRAVDWWLANVPESGIAFWDFSDPAIPNTNTDTAATAMVCASLLKYAELAPSASARARYRSAAERSATALVRGFLTPVRSGDAREIGRLVGACFNKRADARVQDSGTNAEMIVGSYYLYEALNVLTGSLNPIKV